MSPYYDDGTCIGWRSDRPCALWGDWHGCRHPDGHLGAHTCLCGAKKRGGR